MMIRNGGAVVKIATFFCKVNGKHILQPLSAHASAGIPGRRARSP